MEPSSTSSSDDRKGLGEFLRDVATFVVIQVLVLGAFILVFYDADERFPMYFATRVKHDRLDSAPAPRMILVGGSNLFYGLRSETIERRTGYHPVNMGLIGGLRMRFMLNEIRPHLREGDLVVLALELNQLVTVADNANPQVLARLIERRPANARYLTWKQWRMMLDRGALEHVGTVLRAIIDGIQRSPHDAEMLEYINTYGDLTRYHDIPDPTERHAMARTIPKRLDMERIGRNIEILNAFHEECRARGVRVVYTYAPMPTTEFKRRRENAEAMAEILTRECTIPVIMEPEEMVLPARLTIDDYFHLAGRAVDMRTDRLIKIIERADAETGEGPTMGQPP